MEKRLDKITDRYYVKGNLKLISPLILGSGHNDNSDYDVARDWYGAVIVPGTSIAGAIRSYLYRYLKFSDEASEHEIVVDVFGETESRDEDTNTINIGYQSLINFYDCRLDPKINNAANVSVRQGIKINDFYKVAESGSLFDYEIVEPKISFNFKLSLITRQKHKNLNQDLKIEDLLYTILDCLIKEKISLGAKTSRGFGKVKLEDINILHLSMEDHPEYWINFEWDDEWKGKKTYIELNDLKHDLIEKRGGDEFKINIQFKIPYSLLIRTYNPMPGDVDVIHLTLKNNNIISGTSWAGALGSALNSINLTLIPRFKQPQQENVIYFMNELEYSLFGFVFEKEEDIKKYEVLTKRNDMNAQASRIKFKESIIEDQRDSNLLNYTRTKIDRFTGGVTEGSLFSEGISVQGKVNLSIEVENARDYEIGYLLLGLFELWYGLQPLGGTTSIGRGVLEGVSMRLNEEEIKDILNSDKIKDYFNKFLEWINRRLKEKGDQS